MKRTLLSILPVALSLYAQSPVARKPATTRYYVVFIRPDPSRKKLSKADGERLQAAHMANIQQMGRDGVLMAAGPFDDDPPASPVKLSGIFLFTMSSLESAQALAARDRTVVAHRNTVDVHAWQGPPGIGVEYFRLHKQDPKTPENMQSHPLCLLYRGTRWDEKRSTREQVLTAHERYVDRLHNIGKLGAAGAIEAPDDLLGLIIFKPMPVEEAQHLLRDDPAVNKRPSVEWYGIPDRRRNRLRYQNKSSVAVVG
jgi:uncharacterized protein YciI